MIPRSVTASYGRKVTKKIGNDFRSEECFCSMSFDVDEAEDIEEAYAKAYAMARKSALARSKAEAQGDNSDSQAK